LNALQALCLQGVFHGVGSASWGKNFPLLTLKKAFTFRTFACEVKSR
jgi:hypothetical protein